MVMCYVFLRVLRGDDKQGCGDIHVVKCRARHLEFQSADYLERHVELYSVLGMGTGKGQGSTFWRDHGTYTMEM